MCYYPRLVANPKYKPNKKNRGNPPPVTDIRATLVPIGCGKCRECRNQKANEWRVRMMEDIKVNRNAYMVTLTFNNDKFTELYNECDEKIQGYNRDNWIAVRAVRLFTERWRRRFKKTLRHWLVTELGQHNTEHIHLHGIVWTDHPQHLQERWQFGNIHIGTYVNERTVNYIVKYVSKIDRLHPNYKPEILTSNGIGANYVKTHNAKLNKYKGDDTKNYYTTSTGHKIKLPTYYRNKIYNDEEKEKLWLLNLDKEQRFIDGIKIDISDEENNYYRILEKAREKNTIDGYGDNRINWKQVEYENARRILKHKEKINNKKYKKKKKKRTELCYINRLVPKNYNYNI